MMLKNVKMPTVAGGGTNSSSLKSALRRGFTIMELVIVIAVIAVLAAVLIPTFANITERANESNDTQLVRNLNTALLSDVGNEHETMTEALQAVEEAGFDVARINASVAENTILWDSVNDVFCYDNGEEIVYIPESTLTVTNVADYQYWQISATLSDLYSTYLYGYSGDGIITGLTTGLDVGNETISSITYDRSSATDARTVVIRTNSGDTVLTVDAQNDNITHYGAVGTVNVVRVAMASYHENGSVKGNINVAQGNIVVETSATVSNVIVMALNDITPAQDKIAVTVVDAIKSGTKVQDTTGILNDVDGVEIQTATVVKTADELTAAINNGGNIVLSADITSGISVQKDTLLNLGGYTLTGLMNVENGTLTLEGNGTVTNGGHVLLVSGDGTAIINNGNYISTSNVALGVGPTVTENGGKLIVNDANVVAQEACVMSWVDGKVEINGGTFTSKDNFVIGTNGSSDMGNNVITINGGTFNGNIQTSGYIACGIYLANNDVLTLNGGTFNIVNGCGILLRSGTATIGNITINLTADGKVSSGKVGDSTVVVDAAATIVTDIRSGYPGGVPTILKNESGYTVQVIED